MQTLILNSLITIYFFSITVYSQIHGGYPCVFEINNQQTSFIGGNHKPERTNNYQGTNDNSFFPVIIAFVQFASGEPYPNDINWPAGQPPANINSYIAANRNNNYGNEWWNAYSERLSDFWMEASRGNFHVTGKAFSIILPMSAEEYQNNYGSNSIKKINDDIYEALQNHILPEQWYNYDKWSKSGGTFIYAPDSYIDMIYVVHRTWAGVGGMPAGGIAELNQSYSQGNNYTIPNTNLKIHAWHGDIGSGVRMTPGNGGGVSYAPMDIKSTISFSAHEHGHYLWGGNHAMYGKMSGQGADFGVDEFLSPWEFIKLGYMTPKIVNYSITSSYSINDISSRNNNQEGEIIQVPINGQNEFFLICNRQKISSYDIIMWGDTCRGNQFFNLGDKDYGKGVYIYHTPSGYVWPPYMDQECADGLWNYQYEGDITPDWSNTQLVPYFKKLNPVFDKNDRSEYERHLNTLIPSKDGKSCNRYWLQEDTYVSWFGIGKRHTCIDWNQECSKGTDRIFTNLQEVWTSREWQGDRWDAWRVGYNQVFSPYSSPSTRNWNHNQTGIFIYLESQSGTTANFKIYKAGEGGMSEDDILAVTPPSKPVLYREIENYNCNPSGSGWGNPRITWDNNLEPDILRPEGFKRYKIYRAQAIEPYIPANYTLAGIYDDYTPNDTANFIDNNQFTGVRIFLWVFPGV